jgi:hypothetical protein
MQHNKREYSTVNREVTEVELIGRAFISYEQMLVGRQRQICELCSFSSAINIAADALRNGCPSPKISDAIS